jgi:hypothetical protein
MKKRRKLGNRSKEVTANDKFNLSASKLAGESVVKQVPIQADNRQSDHPAYRGYHFRIRETAHDTFIGSKKYERDYCKAQL